MSTERRRFTAGNMLVRTPADHTLKDVQAMFPTEEVREGWPEGDLGGMRGIIESFAPPGAQPPSGGA
jgi:hypothetical protein